MGETAVREEASIFRLCEERPVYINSLDAGNFGLAEGKMDRERARVGNEGKIFLYRFLWGQW